MNIATSPPVDARPFYLMCPPDHFAVTYSINPWMDPKHWAADAAAAHARAKRQWDDLASTLVSAGARVHRMQPPAGLPDYVFTANAAVVLDHKALLARFRHPERQREEPVNATAFQQMHASGLLDAIVSLPDDVVLEGAGDCIWDPVRRLFWMGHGFRSDPRAAQAVTKTFGYRCLGLELTDARFYHLDTALCALPCGGVIYYPGAFSSAALEILHSQVAPEDRIALDESDASAFSANAVAFGKTIVMSRCGPALRSKLEERGYTVRQTPLDAFIYSGGSACCLTLRLDHPSSPRLAREKQSAIGAV
jgi:N-dimethylarginine dimethylaminohydrolase